MNDDPNSSYVKGLKLIYQNGEYEFEYPQDNSDEIAAILSIDAVAEKNKFEIVSENLDNSMSLKEKQALVQVLREADKAFVKPVDDGYNIKVHLKDESLFRYAPRRMFFDERKRTKRNY